MANKTKAESIMGLACVVAGEDVSGRYGKTTTDALDALADALEGGDVRRGRTIAEGITTLAGRAAQIVGNVGALKSALADAGVDAGSGSLADVIAAAAGAVGSGAVPESEIATDDEVRQQLKRSKDQ